MDLRCPNAPVIGEHFQSQPRFVCLSAWAAENVCFESCLVWLFLKCLQIAGWSLRRFSWPIVSNSDLLSPPQGSWDLSLHSVWWPGHDWWHSWDQNAQMPVPSCAFFIAGEWNCSWKPSSTFEPWLLGFCVFKQSFSLRWLDMAPFPQSTCLIFLVTASCALYPQGLVYTSCLYQILDTMSPGTVSHPALIVHSI